MSQGATSSGVGAAAARQAAEYIRQRIGAEWPTPVAGIVLGSGLGGLAERIEDAVRIPFSHVPGFPNVTVAGHAGQLLAGMLGGRPVVALAGRFHLYEGHEASLAAFPVRVLHALGAPVYIASNAAGGVRRTFEPGDLMLIADHMNLMFRNPLIGASEPGLGPTYETPAEVRMLERLGVDAVGMSTVPEVIVARALGMRAVAVSCITNKAAGLSPDKLNHAEVMDAGRAVAARFEQLITEFVRRLP